MDQYKRANSSVNTSPQYPYGYCGDVSNNYAPLHAMHGTYRARDIQGRLSCAVTKVIHIQPFSPLWRIVGYHALGLTIIPTMSY